jgi:hypothetical protein
LSYSNFFLSLSYSLQSSSSSSSSSSSLKKYIYIYRYTIDHQHTSFLSYYNFVHSYRVAFSLAISLFVYVSIWHIAKSTRIEIEKKTKKKKKKKKKKTKFIDLYFCVLWLISSRFFLFIIYSFVWSVHITKQIVTTTTTTMYYDE